MNNRDGVARALLIAGTPREAERLARAVPPGARVVAFAPDRSTADALKAVFARHKLAAAVLVGDAALLVHKVAGSFDIIVDAHAGHAERRERLRTLLSPHGRLGLEAITEGKAGSTDE